VLATYHQAGKAEVRWRPRSRPRRRRRSRVGRGCPGRTGSRVSSCKAAEHAGRSLAADLHQRRDRCSNMSKTPFPGGDRLGLRAGRFPGASTATTTSRILPASSRRSSAGGSGTGSSTGRSRASCSRSRRSTSRAIAGNLPTAPALMGNVALWKPASSTAVLPATGYVMQLLMDAGLPAGRDQLRAGQRQRGRRPGAWRSEHFAGVHFTGSTAVFQGMWADHGRNIAQVPLLPAHRRRDRRQGLRLCAQPPRMWTRSWSRSCAAPSSSRARSARPRAAPTSRQSLWAEIKDELVSHGQDHLDGRARPTSATSWGR
jgi:hypothetical protein